MSPIKVYLVGGAVRDTLLNRPITEHDYVVVGATPQQMLDLGFSQVGADFPVFLHPTTHDEYALARTERKTGKGYHGFQVHADPNVSLEDDLIRRDLTINAMAIEVTSLFDNAFVTGDIIDPYGGRDDINNRQLRHVSTAFCEDPVRVLRLARFASRYAPLGFDIADETVQLVRKMRDDGELDYLVAERVWTETHKALTQSHADIYFEKLCQMGVLGVIMPTFSIMLDESKFAGIWEIVAKSLRISHQFGLSETLKFALLSMVFIRFDSQTMDSDFFQQFCQSLKTPKNYQQFAEFFLTNFGKLQNFNQLSTENLFELVKNGQWLKDNPKLPQALQCTMVYQLAKQQQLLNQIQQQLNPIGVKDIEQNLQGKAIGEAIDRVRLQVLTELQQDFLRII